MECKIRGCRNLETRCLDCGRLVCEKTFTNDMKWISVKDKLPEKGTVVLLYQTWPKETMFNCRADPLRRNFTRLGGLRYDNLFIDYQNQYGEPLKHISHWMPLPDAPKE